MTAIAKYKDANNYDNHRFLALLPVLLKWYLRVLIVVAHKKRVPMVQRRLWTVGFSAAQSTNSVLGILGSALQHSREWTWVNNEVKQARKNLVHNMMSMDFANFQGKPMLEQLALTSGFCMPPMNFTFINVRKTSGHNHESRVPAGTRKCKEVIMNRFMFASNCNHVT